MTDAPRHPVRLLDIERELAGPDADAALARYDALLADLDARLAAALDAGLPPDEFAPVQELQKANVVARKILRLAVRDAKMAPQPRTI